MKVMCNSKSIKKQHNYLKFQEVKTIQNAYSDQNEIKLNISYHLIFKNSLFKTS